MLSPLLLICALQIASPATQPAAPAHEEDVARAIVVGETTIKPYDPQSSLIVDQHPIDWPKFAVIDVHCHWFMQQDPAFLLREMDKVRCMYAVNLSGGFGPQLDAMLTRFHDPRLKVLANLDFSKIDQPDFAQQQITMLRDAKAKGLAGLKVFKSLGLTIKDASGTLVPVDDPRIAPVFEACGELNLPILIHSGDPLPFFQPTDTHNERDMQLLRHPDWSWFGPQYPTWDEVIAQRNRMIAAHPKTQFIVAHLGEAGNNLKLLGEWLDAMPNMVVDLSGRENELGRQPFSARKFLIKYSDRVLFGTDRYPGRPDQPRYKILYRMLETEDEYFDYYDHPFPPTGEWKIYGLNLPDDVLQKIYAGSAMRVFNLQPIEIERPAESTSGETNGAAK